MVLKAFKHKLVCMLKLLSTLDRQIRFLTGSLSLSWKNKAIGVAYIPRYILREPSKFNVNKYQK